MRPKTSNIWLLVLFADIILSGWERWRYPRAVNAYVKPRDGKSQLEVMVKTAIIVLIGSIILRPLIVRADDKFPPKGFKLKDGWLLEWKGSSQKLEAHAEKLKPKEDLLSGIACFSPESFIPEKREKIESEVGKDVIWCSCYSETLLPIPYKGATFYFYKNQFFQVRAEFDPSDYQTIQSSLVSALGNPSKSAAGKVQNAFGAQFDQATSEWTTKEVLIQLSKRSEKIDEGALTMTNLPISQKRQRQPVTPPF